MKRVQSIRLGVLVTLLTILTALLAACGDPTAAPATTTAAAATTAAATTTASATTAAAATTAASATTAAGGAAQTVAPVANGNKTGVTDTEIKISSSTPQTGGASAYGIVSRVQEAYFKDINDAGGINGRKIKYTYEDDKYVPANTLANAKKFVEQDKVFALLGCIGTANNLGMKDYLAENGVPNIAFATGSGLLVNPQGFQKLGFGVLPNYTFEGNILATYAADTLKVKTVSIIYQNDAFGKEGYQSFVATAKKKGLEVKAEVPYEAGASDLSAQALKLQTANADLVFVNAVPGPGAAAVKEMDKLGYKPKFMLTFVLNDAQFWGAAGKAAEGAYTTSFTPLPDSDDPKVVKFRDFMKKYLPNEQVGNFALWGYVGAQVMEEGLRRAGKDLSRETLVAGLESIENWGGTLTAAPISYGKDNRTPVKALFLLQYKEGKTAKISDPIEYK